MTYSKMERTGKEVTVTYFDILLPHLLGGNAVKQNVKAAMRVAVGVAMMVMVTMMKVTMMLIIGSQ
jgi:hypothetical protein